MGWVRLFYWYGIIPTALIAVAILLLIYICYKKRDPWTLLIILSVSVYTIIEATFVSRYIGRAFYLMIAGVYFGYLFKGKTNE
jgi:low affinity Fe/Cu permease